MGVGVWGWKDTHLRLDPCWREGNHPDGRQTQLAVAPALVLPLQEALQALLQHLIGSGSTGGVDELWVQVEGSAGQLSTATGPEAGLEDRAQPRRRVLRGDALSGKDNKDIKAGFQHF